MTDQKSCINNEIGKLLAAYEMGLLCGEEQSLIENHLNACEYCSESLWRMAPALDAFHAEPGEMAEILRGRWFDRLTARILPREGTARFWKFSLPAVAAAAVVLLIVTLNQTVARFDPASVARIEPLEYIQFSTRGFGTSDSGPSDGPGEFQTGIALYNQARYQGAATTLARSARLFDYAGLERDQAALYAGLSHLLVGASDSALVYLKLAIESEAPVIRDRAVWFLAQASLLRCDTKTAKKYLERLATDSPGYAAEAREQLKHINDRIDEE